MHNAPCRVDIAHKVSLFGGEVCIYCAGSCLVVPQLEIYGQVPQCMHPPKKEHNQFEFGLYSKLRNEGVRIGAMLQIRQSKWFIDHYRSIDENKEKNGIEPDQIVIEINLIQNSLSSMKLMSTNLELTPEIIEVNCISLEHHPSLVTHWLIRTTFLSD